MRFVMVNTSEVMANFGKVSDVQIPVKVYYDTIDEYGWTKGHIEILPREAPGGSGQHHGHERGGVLGSVHRRRDETPDRPGDRIGRGLRQHLLRV